MSTKPPYCVAYAKSNRSKCVQCKEGIVQGKPRIGKLERSTKFDGEYYCWRHPKCFFDSYSVSFSELSGGSDLKWDTQEGLKKRCVGGDGDDDVEEDTREVSWICEYARSNRSTCRGCGEKIDKAILRVGKVVFDEDTGYNSTYWHHATDCVNMSTDVKKSKDVQGYKSLAKKDQKTIDKLVKGLKKKRKQEDKEAAQGAKKKQKKQKVDKKAAEKLWNTKEELQKQYSTNELRGILRACGFTLSGGPTEILQRVADFKIHGAFGECPMCSQTKLSRNGDDVGCHGSLSEWSRCTYMAKNADVKRVKWKIPSEDDIDEAVEELKEKKRKEKEKELEAIEAAKAALSGAAPAKKKKKKQPVKKKKKKPAKKKDPKKMTVGALKKELKSRGIKVPSKAKKKQLVQLIQDASSSESSSSDSDSGSESDPEPIAKGVAVVDESSGYSQDNATVLQDAAGFSFATVLAQTDMGFGTLGKNSFYKMQLLQISKKNFQVYCRWGRVGEDGNTVNKPFSTNIKAVAFFTKKFMERTGASWFEYIQGN